MSKLWLVVAFFLASAAWSSSAVSASNNLAWKVQDEENVFGYIVYRAEQRAGPFLRVSSKVVRRQSPQSGQVATYTYADTGVTPGVTYYYFIDVISVSGMKQRLSGVLSKKVKVE